MKPIILSRHAGVVAWLAARAIVGDVVAHATPDQVRGRVVYGVLPLHLAVLAAAVWSVDLPGLTPEQRGQDLTPAEMDSAGAILRGYKVQSLRVGPTRDRQEAAS